MLVQQLRPGSRVEHVDMPSQVGIVVGSLLAQEKLWAVVFGDRQTPESLPQVCCHSSLQSGLVPEILMLKGSALCKEVPWATVKLQCYSRPCCDICNTRQLFNRRSLPFAVLMPRSLIVRDTIAPTVCVMSFKVVVLLTYCS